MILVLLVIKKIIAMLVLLVNILEIYKMVNAVVFKGFMKIIRMNVYNVIILVAAVTMHINARIVIINSEDI